MDRILYINKVTDTRIREMVTKTESSKYNTNGHSYVDLGLPSGTLWATMNVGAQSETDPGLYFAWGETLGYLVQLVNNGKEDIYEIVGKSFSMENYLFAALNKFGKYYINKYYSDDEKTVLDLEDDAAHVNMGGDWHMPSPAQIEELSNTDYVTNEFIENYKSSGVSGLLLTSVADSTKKLFIPFNGDINLIINKFNQILIWSNTVSEEMVTDANLLFGDSYNSKLRINQYYRYFGLGVRGVIGQTTLNAPGTSYGNDDPVNTDPGNLDPSSPAAPKPGVGEEIAGGKN